MNHKAVFGDRLWKAVKLEEVLLRSMIERENTKKEDIVLTGYDWLDEQITGIFPSELFVIGGESGVGKTSFCTHIAYKISKTRKVCIFALEDRLLDYGKKAIYFEIIKILNENNDPTAYSWNEYARNEIKDRKFNDLCVEAYERLKHYNVEFIEAEEQMDIELLEEIVREKVKDGTEFFLLDHLHYFDFSKGKEKKADYIEQIMIRLKTLLNSTGARMWMIVHYKKLDGKKPSMDSFKDSISISQNANYIIHLWRERHKECDTSLFLSKARNPNGEKVITLHYERTTNVYTQTFGTTNAFETT